MDTEIYHGFWRGSYKGYNVSFFGYRSDVHNSTSDQVGENLPEVYPCLYR